MSQCDNIIPGGAVGGLMIAPTHSVEVILPRLKRLGSMGNGLLANERATVCLELQGTDINNIRKASYTRYNIELQAKKPGWISGAGLELGMAA